MGTREIHIINYSFAKLKLSNDLMTKNASFDIQPENISIRVLGAVSKK
jgi:hypothetical protein